LIQRNIARCSGAQDSLFSPVQGEGLMSFLSNFFWPIVALCTALGAAALWFAFRLLVMWITLD
jgi:hypothetical protein